MESKKKNIIRRETEAPKGRHMACKLSSVVTLLSFFSFSSPSSPFPSSMAKERKDPYTISKMEMKNVETREESMILYANLKDSAE